jgi:hypothetical protein
VAVLLLEVRQWSDQKAQLEEWEEEVVVVQ